MSDINYYPVGVNLEMLMLEQKYGENSPEYREGEKNIVKHYLETNRNPQTCAQCAKALGWSNQRTVMILRTLTEEGSIEKNCSHKDTQIYDLKKPEGTIPKKQLNTMPPCEKPVHDFSWITLVVGLIAIFYAYLFWI